MLKEFQMEITNIIFNIYKKINKYNWNLNSFYIKKLVYILKMIIFCKIMDHINI